MQAASTNSINDIDGEQSTDPIVGLTESQVEERKAKGLTNDQGGTVTKSVGQIIAGNLCTLFNLINAILAGLVIFTGSYKNALFMIVIITNLAVGIVQEIRAKKTIDKLSLISAPTAKLLRDGKHISCPVSEVVQDDIAFLSIGDQVYADMIIIDGECEVNESQVTGESEPVFHKKGDRLLSGAFIISGDVTVQMEKVGAESYSARLANSAKYIKKPNSEIMSSLNFIIKIISIAIAPMGILLFLNQVILLEAPQNQAIVKVVAALIGMIPEGLVLLASVVLAVSVIRLAKHKTLVQELYCIETLARVDMLCLDKTGTITEGRMELEDILPIDKNRNREEISEIFGKMTGAMEDHSATFTALREYFAGKDFSTPWQVRKIVPFNSVKKWSGITFEEKGSFVIGAAEFIYFNRLKEKSAEDEVLEATVKKYSDMGRRVLLLAHSREDFNERELPGDLHPLALAVLSDVIRPEAYDTLKFFREQGVNIKVISGDNPETVASVAGTAGLKDADNYIDVSRLTDTQLEEEAVKHTVFGRVTPQQKLILIKALKKAGHTVAMTGDGVNDVPALKEADCSIAMAAGSDAARQVSQLVLLDSNFASMPKIVAEGRRSINNIQRSASLFLVKTIFSFVLTLVFLFLPKPYPFQPIQLTLISALCVGIPSFILALEPNKERISGRFIYRVIQKALPGGSAVALGVLLTVCLGPVLGLSEQQTSTVAVLITAFNMFAVLFKTCLPFDWIRRALFWTMLGLFCTGFVIFGWFFGFTFLNLTMAVMLGCLIAICLPFMILALKAVNYFIRKQ